MNSKRVLEIADGFARRAKVPMEIHSVEYLNQEPECCRIGVACHACGDQIIYLDFRGHANGEWFIDDWVVNADQRLRYHMESFHMN